MTVQQLAGLLIDHIGNKSVHAASEFEVSDLVANWAAIGELTAGILRSDEMYASYIDTSTITADNAFIKYLECCDAIFNKVTADVGEFGSIYADVVRTKDLDALKANINELVAEYIRTTDLVTETATIEQLLGGIAKFLTMVAGSVVADDVVSFKISSEHLEIGDAFIKDAMIDSVTASKITAGILNTGKVQVRSESGNLVIADNTIQISDGVKVRVQLGEDASGDYNMYVFDAEGNLMWNALGITADAIKSAIIKDGMVAEDANISGSKINISSVIKEINSNTEKLKMSSIYMDADAQTLDVWFNAMESWKSSTSTWQTNTDTQIEIINGKFSSYVSQTEKAELEGQISTLSQQYSEIKQTADGIELSVKGLETTTTEITDSLAEATVNLTANTEAKITAEKDNIMQSIKSVYQTKEDAIGESNKYNVRISELEQTLDGFTVGFGNVQGAETAVQELIERALERYSTYFLFTEDGLYIGKQDSPFTLRLTDSAMEFLDGTNVVAYTTNNKLLITDAEILYSLRLGNFEFVPRKNGNLSLRWRE